MLRPSLRPSLPQRSRALWLIRCRRPRRSLWLRPPPPPPLLSRRSPPLPKSPQSSPRARLNRRRLALRSFRLRRLRSPRLLPSLLRRPSLRLRLLRWLLPCPRPSFVPRSPPLLRARPSGASRSGKGVRASRCRTIAPLPVAFSTTPRLPVDRPAAPVVVRSDNRRARRVPVGPVSGGTRSLAASVRLVRRAVPAPR